MIHHHNNNNNNSPNNPTSPHTPNNNHHRQNNDHFTNTINTTNNTIIMNNNNNNNNHTTTNKFTWLDFKETLSTNRVKILSFLQCVLGIYISFIILSLYQERISKKIYPKTMMHTRLMNQLPVDEVHEHTSVHTKEEDMFRYAIFIVFLTCLVNTLFSYVRMRIYFPRLMESGLPATSLSHSIKFILASVCFVCGTIFSHGALNYVSYPTQVLTKSCKLIPVMVSTIVVARKTYRTSRYVVVMLISIGVSVFMIDRMKHNEILHGAAAVGAVGGAVGDAMSHSTTHLSNNHLFLTKEEGNAYEHSMFRTGIILLLLSLVMDGLTNGVQTIIYNDNNRVKKRRNMESESDTFMLNINLYATVISAIICIVYESEMLLSIKFILSHREIMWDLSVLCTCMAFGQMFIFRTITNYGPLVCSMLTTTRKFFTILFSVMVFRHELTRLQWLGIAIVFGALLFDIYETLKATHENDIKDAAGGQQQDEVEVESSTTSLKIHVRSHSL